MKTPCLLVLCVALLAIRATGQVFLNPLDGTLVDCKTDKVVILEGTESKDGHFAAGWTLRPNRKKTPVDWAAYQRKDPEAFLAKFSPGDDPGKGDYLVVDGVLDLRARTFTPLPSRDPYFPGQERDSLRVAWSDDRQGSRDAVVSHVVGSNHSENSVELSLVTLGSGAPRIVDLKPAADQAVKDYLHKRDPKDAPRYQWSYDFTEFAGGKKSTPQVFHGDALTIHFNAEIPLEDSEDPGTVSFALPKGSVTGTASDKKK